MRSNPKPLLEGKLYPREKGLYFKLLIWKNLKELRQHLNWLKIEHRCHGLCTPYSRYKIRDGKRVRLPICGEVNIIKAHLNAEVLSHELCHAAFAWAERAGIDVTEHSAGSKANFMSIKSGEELFCYAQGTMVNQAARLLIKGKLWK